jgi:hypothetical protein
MAVWPFRSRARRASAAAAQEQLAEPNVFAQTANRSTTALPSRRSSRASITLPWRKGSLAKGSDGNSLQVKSLGPIVPISPINSEFDHRPQTPDSQASAEDITALPQSKVLKTSPHLRPANRENADMPYDFRLHSSSSRLNTPTAPRQFNSLRKFGRSHRESSQPGDVREEELRAMSSPAMPLRAPGRGDPGILRRESKKVRSGLNMNFERPESTISLPRPDTGRGSMMRQPDARSYRISIMDIMSPRPIIKSTEPYSMIALGVTDNSRAPSRRQATATETESGRRSKRINDLADNLDSTGLRAVMEREQRRKEMKKEADAEKLRRRLERRAEKQRADDNGDEPALNPFQDFIADEAAQVTAGASRTRSKRRHKQRARRRSSSASRPETNRKPKDEAKSSDPPPVPPKPETPARIVSAAAEKSKWPVRSDSRAVTSSSIGRKPSIPLRTAISKDILVSESETYHTPPMSIHEEAILTPDRIVPEEDPDDAEPPVIARSRHPAHEIPHVAHLYSRHAPPSPIRTHEPVLDISAIEPPTSFAPNSPEPTSANEPVLDLTSVEPPAFFAPADTETRENEPSLAEENDLSRGSPLMPNDGEEIPGLPFLSSVGSDSDSPIVSPFAASFPTSFPDSDFAAPAPTVHRDPQREARFSSLSPTSADHQLGSTSSITALPQVPTKIEPDVEKPKRKRGPSLLLSFFRRGSRARAASDTAAAERADSATKFSPGFQHDSAGRNIATAHGGLPSNIPVSQFASRLGSPVRSQSRFKEDLAGLNILVPNQARPPSPPESRVNSPYNQITPSSPEYGRGALITPISHPRYSEQSTYGIQQQDNRRRSQSLNRMSNPLSKSLASIDSEGSWLMGKPVGRGLSQRSAQPRNLATDPASMSLVQGRHHRKQSGHSSASDDNQEPLMSADDHFGLRPATPVRPRYVEKDIIDGGAYGDEHSLNTGRMASSEVIAKSNTHDAVEDHSAPPRLSKDISVRKPELKQGIRVKSSEGLFKNYLGAAINTDDGSFKEASIYEDTSNDNTPVEKDQAQVLRAMSVKAPQRAFSDGSGAKLIEVSSKRDSTDRLKKSTQ